MKVIPAPRKFRTTIIEKLRGTPKTVIFEHLSGTIPGVQHLSVVGSVVFLHFLLGLGQGLGGSLLV